jgi:A/G-specific adenine glycosylase
MDVKTWNEFIHWSESIHKDLPWRIDRTIYGTLVSEIMLQQTTVATVRNKFSGFIKRFPTLKALADATDDAIAIEWKGLGYYRRARNLKKAAEYFVSVHGGEIPKDIEALKKAPGVGVYTANAISAIGYNQKALAIDANIERVLSRLYKIADKKGPALQRAIEQLFSQGKIAKGIKNFRGFNEALMDLGRVYCQARTVKCLTCPMMKSCLAFAQGNPLELPLQDKKARVTHELELIRFLVHDKDQILGYRKLDDQWLSGQVELPTYVLNCSDDQFNQYPRLPVALDKDLKKLPILKTGITKYAINNKILTLSMQHFKKLLGTSEAKRYKFFSVNEKQENLAATTIKVLMKVSL